MKLSGYTSSTCGRLSVDFQWFLHDSIFHQTLANNNLIHVSIKESAIQQLNYPLMGKKIFSHFESLFKFKKKKEKYICFVWYDPVLTILKSVQ